MGGCVYRQMMGVADVLGGVSVCVVVFVGAGRGIPAALCCQHQGTYILGRLHSMLDFHHTIHTYIHQTQPGLWHIHIQLIRVVMLHHKQGQVGLDC